VGQQHQDKWVKFPVRVLLEYEQNLRAVAVHDLLEPIRTSLLAEENGSKVRLRDPQ